MATKPVFLRAALVGTWVLFSASVLFRPHQAEYNAWFDVGLYALPFLVAALAAFVRARQEPAGSGWTALGVVVEGVENQESMKLVVESNAARAQWYFISHPLPAAQLMAYLAPAEAVSARTGP